MSAKENALSWNRELNLSAYADVEADSNYATPELLENYRGLLLRKSVPAAKFIEQVGYRGTKLKVLELCSGSSRLLYMLDQMKILAEGHGVEVSPSRHKFAENWKAALGLSHVHNVERGAAEYQFTEEGLDVAVLIDGALSYLYPFNPALPEQVLRNIHRCLVSGGNVVMEFDVLSEQQVDSMRRDGRVRTWNKGDDKDAFQYALYHTEPMSWDHMVVQNTSIYLPRTGAAEKVKREVYKYYGAAELSTLLNEIGFDVSFFGSFMAEPFTSESTTLVALATKR